MASPFNDPAESILRGDPALTDELRASLWDEYHSSHSPTELAQTLEPLDVPSDTKHQLYLAKQSASGDPALTAMNKMADIDPKTLELAEAHPTVLKALISAMLGQSGDKKKQQPQENLPPRADGQPHFPPIPDGHKRVLASDGGVHDIPEANIEHARKIDPNLHVLNP